MGFNFVGTNFREKCLEFLFMTGGICLYHVYLRPKEVWESRKKRKNRTADRKAKGAEKAATTV